MKIEYREVSVKCPCCGLAGVDVVLVMGGYPEDPFGWDVEEFASECDCHDFVGRLKGKFGESGDVMYVDYLRDRALEGR